MRIPEKAARKLLEIADTVEAIQDGRIHIEKINAPFLEGQAVLLSTAPASPSRSRAAPR